MGGCASRFVARCCASPAETPAPATYAVPYEDAPQPHGGQFGPRPAEVAQGVPAGPAEEAIPTAPAKGVLVGSPLMLNSDPSNTPLHEAAIAGDADTLQLLMEEWVGPLNPQNSAGLTPFDVAKLAGHEECAQHIQILMSLMARFDGEEAVGEPGGSVPVVEGMAVEAVEGQTAEEEPSLKKSPELQEHVEERV